MGKNERIRRMKKEGMHEIKNKYRVRAVNKKKKGLVMTAKKKRRALKAGASLSAIFVLILGVFAIGSAFLSSVVPNVVPDDFVTVSYELPTDGSNPADHSALENIGYMNYRFKNQNGWYAEMHGTTTSMGIAQSVNTIKQYSDGVLIMADVTSGFANAGRQFCYVGDEVMWRELPKNSSYKMDSFEDMLALTFNDELEAHMTIPAFKEKNGLPGTEMSVYIINEDTLDRADPVELVTTGEWDDKDFAEKPVYRQTYYLRPGDSEHLGAAAHYANQMAFTGGLTGLPEFNYITVTYTFDSSWQILRAEINEAYKAQMGITVNCTSDFKTDYEYGTDRAYNSVYESYYKDLVGVGIDDNVEKPLDSTALLISSFLTKPVTFEVELEIDGKKTSGIISLDASKLDLEAIMESGSPDIAAALGGVIVDLDNFDFKGNPRYASFNEPDESYHGLVYSDLPAAVFATKCRAQMIRDMGAIMSPQNGFLSYIGSDTLALRMERHSSNAEKVAEYLSKHPKIEWVRHPSLKNNKYHALAEKYLPNGCGGMLSFGIRGGKELCAKFMESLKLITQETHVADVRSCVLHPASTTHRQLSKEDLEKAGVPENLIRLSVGIENPADIIADLEQALKNV